LLDVGSGSGRNLPVALERGYRVHALDPSPSALAEVRARFPEVSRIASDLEGCTLAPGSVDVVQDFSVLHCAPPERQARHVARVHDLLVPGGHWLLACWATDPATGWFSHVVNGALAEWGVAPSTLRRLVQGRFHLLDAILLADAEPLPLAHYLLKKGDGPPGEWPADPPHDGSFADEHGRWRFEPGYPYPILERYLG
jgi:SAM-dependent methyltransferase